MSDISQNPLRPRLDALAKITPKRGGETWSARDLWEPLGYARWESFEKVIARAIETRREAGLDSAFHFRELTTPAGDGDFRLTRLACHLIVMAGDGRKKPIAFARAYFAETPEAKPKPTARVALKQTKAQASKVSGRPAAKAVAKAAAKPAAASKFAASPAKAQRKSATKSSVPDKPVVNTGSRFIPKPGDRFYGSTHASRNSRWNPNCAVSRGYHNSATTIGR